MRSRRSGTRGDGAMGGVPGAARWLRLLVLTLIVAPAAFAQITYLTIDGRYRTLRTEGRYAEALEALTEEIEGLDLDYTPPGPFVERAQLLFEVGRVDEAISVMEAVVRRYPDPAYTIPLAEYYLYRGRLTEYQAALQIAMLQAQGTRRYAQEWETAVALARMLELQGENPRRILNTYLELWTQRLATSSAPFVAAGDLAYRKYSYDVAADYYTRALELDPTNQSALAGLAECYWKSSDPRVEETLEKLTAINPNHPRARAIEVERLLDLGDAEAALAVIGDALKINPNDLQFLSLKAAAHFLQDDEAAMQATRTRILDFNPHYAGAFAVPARVASRHYRFAEASEMLREAIRIAPEDPSVRADLAFNLLRLGEQEEGRTHLERAFEKDPYHVQAYNMLEVLDDLDAFHTVETPSFRIQLPEQEAVVLAGRMTELLDRALAIYQEKYDVRVSTPVLVQMFDDHDAFMVRSIGLPGNAGHLGICFGRLVTMDSPRARPPGASNWELVLWHEFVHVITLQKTSNRIPRWLSEGISVYEELTGSPAWGQRLDVRFKPILEKDGWPKLDDLERYFTQPETAMHLMLGYFLGGEFVRFYTAEYGDRALVGALERIGDGVETSRALIDAAGTTRNALDRAFAAYLEQRCRYLKNIPTPPPAEGDEALIAIAMPEAWMRQDSPFTDALRTGARLIEEESWEGAATLLEAAHRLYPDYMGGDAPLRQLARLHRTRGDREALIATLRRIVAWDNTAFDESRELARLMREEEQWHEVGEAARLAFAINPFDIDNLRDLHESNRRLGRIEEAIETAGRLAFLDRARAVDHRMERARLLADAGRDDEALNETLALLEQIPHFWEAQELLLRIYETPEGARR